ncbi:MAG: hypothetical protein AABW48_03230 [Nanoarchaeota archaeon]
MKKTCKDANRPEYLALVDENTNLLQRDGLYAVIENRFSSAVHLVQSEPTGNDCRTHFEDQRMESHLRCIDETLMNLVDLRDHVRREVEQVRQNPVREQWKWWSTGELMNRDEVRHYHTQLAMLSRKLLNVEGLMTALAEDKYEIRKIDSVIELDMKQEI